MAASSSSRSWPVRSSRPRAPSGRTTSARRSTHRSLARSARGRGDDLANMPWWELFHDPPLAGADPDRARREPGSEDRRRAHRRGPGALRFHQGRSLPADRRQRVRRARLGQARSAHPRSRRRAPITESLGLLRRRGRDLGDRLLRPVPAGQRGRARAVARDRGRSALGRDHARRRCGARVRRAAGPSTAELEIAAGRSSRGASTSSWPRSASRAG